jgi:hypothetical protein
MRQQVARKRMGLAAVTAAAGLAASAGAGLTITPTDIVTWGGTGTGRSLSSVQPSGLTWAWTNSQPSGVVISSDGRVYFQGQYAQTPATGTIPTNNHRAIFTATNSTDLQVFDGFRDGAVKDGNDLRNASGSLGGISTVAPRISGTKVAFGVQISGGTPAIIESGTGQNNSAMYIGDFAGGASRAAQRADTVTLNNVSGVPTAVSTSTDLRNLSQQFSQINSSGTMLMALGVPAAAGSFVTTANATSAPFGNSGFLATKSVGGAYTVIAQGGQAAPGVPGAIYQNGTSNNGVGGFFAKINRNGQVAYDAKLVTQFPVTSSSDDVAYIHTPGMGTTLVRRENQIAPDATGAPDAGGALYSGGITAVSKSFSNAGLMFTSNLSGGDVVTTPGAQNDSALYIATTTGTTRVIRRNDPIPSLGANVNLGVINMAGSGAGMNNNGFMAFGATLQGSGVTASVAPQTTFAFPPNPSFVTATGTFGNDQVIMAGFAGGLQAIARKGDLVPGTDGLRFDIDISGAQLVFNNSNEIMFTTNTTRYAAGDTIGVVGLTTAESILPAGPRMLMGWSAAYGLVPLLTDGQLVEVEPGVFKRLVQWSVSPQDNGDGGAAGLNDSGRFTARLSFDDNSWAVTTLQIPAPSAGVLALMGLGAMGRRRRNV